MDEVLGAIDIEGKKLVCSAKDVAQLSTPAGCQLQVVTDKVHKLYEDYDDDDDEGGGGGGGGGDNNNPDDSVNIDDMTFDGNSQADNEGTDKRLREYRRKREFISLVLNANRDPVKPGTKSRFKEYQELDELEAEAEARAKGEADGGNDDFDCMTRNLEWNNHVGIHRMYANMGNYEKYLKEHNFQEISPGRIYKLQRVPGVQLPVNQRELVIYNCAFWTEGSKEPFDSTWLRRTTITSHLEYDSILPGLHELLLTCTKGELCEAFLRPEVAFGKLGVKPRIPENATIFCLLEVVKVVSRDKFAAICARQQRIDTGEAFATTTSTMYSNDSQAAAGHSTMMLQFGDLYEASDEARQRGNYFYQQGQYRIALQRYKSAIRLLEGLTYRNSEEETQAQSLLIKLYNNCARTANAMGAPRLALAACKQARLINDLDPKTHWHRMSAWQMKGHTDKALGVARRAIQLFDHHEPSVREFRKVADRLVLKLQQERREVDELHRLMGRALLTSSA